MALWDQTCFATEVANATGVATISCLESVFKNAVNAIIALSGVALFIMLIISGFNFLFSGGDQKKLEKARGTMTQAIIGLVIISCAFLILQTIKVLTGVDVTRFDIIIRQGTEAPATSQPQMNPVGPH